MSAQSARQKSWLDEGFSIWPMVGKFVPSIASFYFRDTDSGLVFRIEVDPRHCNGAGFAHGGYLATIADIVLGYNIKYRNPGRWRMATAGLSVQYLAPVAAEQWIEGVVDRVWIGKRFCHASGVLNVEGTPIAAMQGSFAVLNTTGERDG